jgi:hypothetical protein
MWGRLDGASHLVNMLLAPDSLRRSLVDGVAQNAYELRRDTIVGCVDNAALRQQLDDFRAGCLDGATDAQLRQAVDPVRREMIAHFHRLILDHELRPMAADRTLTADTKAAIESLAGDQPRYGEALTGVRCDLGRTTTGRLADSAQGHEVIGMMASSALRALSRDPRLPGGSNTARPLGVAAHVIRVTTRSGWQGVLARIFMALLLVALTLSTLWAGLVPESVPDWLFRATLALAAVVAAFVTLPLMPHWFRRGFGWLKRAPVGLLKR